MDERYWPTVAGRQLLRRPLDSGSAHGPGSGSIHPGVGNRAMTGLLAGHGEAALVQRAIEKGPLEHALSNGQAPALLEPQATQTALRDRQETIMLFDELAELRAAWGNAPPLWALVDQVSETLNRNEPITAAKARTAITDYLRQSESADPRTKVESHGADERFLDLLAARRGSYHWQTGASDAFKAWINLENPEHTPLPDTAHINCWEAVLAAAADAGLVTFDDLREAYATESVVQGVDDLLTLRGAQEVTHPAGHPVEVSAGDVIMLPGESGPMHHVVVVITPGGADYTQVEVLSLWTAFSGGGFGKVPLDRLLTPNMTFRLSTL